MIVVGGGLSGLYAAYRLVPRRVTVLSGNAGGKVRTVAPGVELGPSIFHSGQPHMVSLVDAMHLTKVAIPYERDVIPVPTSGATVGEVLTPHHPAFEESRHMSVQWWQASERTIGTVYTIKEGWATLVRRLRKYLKRRGVVFKQEQVQEIGYGTHGVRVVTDKGEHHGSDVIVCVSLEDTPAIFFNLPAWKHYVAVRQVAQTVPTTRVYVQLAAPVAPFAPIFQADSSFLWCIHIREDLLLLSYTDGAQAQQRAFSALHPSVREEALQRFVDQCVQEVSAVLRQHLVVQRIWAKYWPTAFTILHGHGHVPLAAYKRMHRINQHVYQTFLPSPLHQAWVESHLRQAARCVADVKNEVRPT